MKITNRRAFYEYEILDKFEAGINLTGPEVKAVRGGHVDLSRSFVRIIGSEAYLVNARILPYLYARPEDYEESRTRKLLLHKKEIVALKSRIDASGLTIVPISVYTKDRLIKTQLALAKGKKQYQKKEALKKKDIQREVEEEFQSSLK